MISRLMLSLKKAADTQQTSWSLGQPSVSLGVDFQSMEKFSYTQKGIGDGEDEISLGTCSSRW